MSIGMACLLFVAVYFGMRFLVVRFVGTARDYRDALLARQQQRLAKMMSSVKVGKIYITCLTIGLVLGVLAVLVMKSFILAIFALLVALFMPRLILSHLEKKRLETFESQFPDALGVLANGLRAGIALPNALMRVGDEMGWPVGDEFKALVGDLKVGQEKEAWLNMTDRLPLKSVKLFSTAIVTCSGKGVNFAEMCDRISETIRRNLELQRELDAMTAEGRMQGWLMGSMPFIMCLLLYFVSPDFIEPLFTTTAGIVILILVVVMEAVGALVIREILQLEE
jgi:tight adherence protein B